MLARTIIFDEWGSVDGLHMDTGDGSVENQFRIESRSLMASEEFAEAAQTRAAVVPTAGKTKISIRA